MRCCDEAEAAIIQPHHVRLDTGAWRGYRCLSSRAMHPCDKDLYEIEYRRSLATPFPRRDRPSTWGRSL